jgi:hypothetical protein
MGDVQDLDARFRHRSDDLPSDLGSLALVGAGERLVAEQQRGPLDRLRDLTHPIQFLFELAARHRRIFFPLEVREDARARVSAERFRADEHARLHHQLGEPDAAEERRLTAPVDAGDHEQRLPVGVYVVADDLSVEMEGERDVVELSYQERGLV